jgi:hypothetical protein
MDNAVILSACPTPMGTVGGCPGDGRGATMVIEAA